MTTKTDNIAAAAEDWLRCKAAEEAARIERLEIEGVLDSLLGHKEEGAETHEAGPYQVTITGKLTRSWDMERLGAIMPEIPEDLRPLRTKQEVDLAGVRWLENNEPEVYRKLAQALVTKPAKTEIKVVIKEEKAHGRKAA